MPKIITLSWYYRVDDDYQLDQIDWCHKLAGKFSEAIRLCTLTSDDACFIIPLKFQDMIGIIEYFIALKYGNWNFVFIKSKSNFIIFENVRIRIYMCSENDHKIIREKRAYNKLIKTFLKK